MKEFTADDDDDARSICTAVPHKLHASRRRIRSTLGTEAGGPTR